MKTLQNEESMRFLEQVPKLNRQLRWMRLWNWPGWMPLLAVLQIGLWTGLFLWSGPLIRLLDPSAAVVDTGIISQLLFVLMVVHAFVISAWLLLRLIRETLTGFYEWDEAKQEFTSKLTPCLEAKIITISFWGLVSFFAFIFTVLL